MIHALEAAGLAWIMVNVALFVVMNREDTAALSRRTIDRFWRAIVCREAYGKTSRADA